MGEREQDALRSAIESVTPIVHLSNMHPASVQTQSEDGRVSVDIEDGGPMSGASNVPDVYGLPHVRCKLSQGARGRVAFDNGDPRKRTFGTFDAGTPADEINIGDAQSTQGAARIGDKCSAGRLFWVPSPPANGIPTGGTIFYQAPTSDPNAAAPPIPWLIIVGPVAGVEPDGPLDLVAHIHEGSSLVKIGG